MTSKSFINSQDIEKIEPSVQVARVKLEKAGKFFSFAKKAKSFGEPEMIYAPAYDATRIACESLLLLNGFRVKKSSSQHHYIVIGLAKELTQGEMDDEFMRMQKMRKKRNKLEYGNLESISESELKQAMEDAGTLIKGIDKLILEKED